jgi:hypothetical protein
MFVSHHIHACICIYVYIHVPNHFGSSDISRPSRVFDIGLQLFYIMSDSDVSAGANGSERSVRAPSTKCAKNSSVIHTCGLCTKSGTDVTARFYGDDFCNPCVAACRSKTRMLAPAAKNKDKKLFQQDRPAWQDRFWFIGR